MEPEIASVYVTADWLLEEALRRYPTTGAIFLQYGPMYRARADRLFPEYPPITVGEYAELNGVNVQTLLRLLNAAAEAEEFARKFAWLPRTAP